MQIEEILIIKNGSENYGISTSEINQISRVPMLMPFPLRPFGVRGLCAVSGNIVSMIDINLLLDSDEVDYEADKSRILSLNAPYASNAILVGEVYNTVEIQEHKIEYKNVENDPVIAIYKYKDYLVQIISLEILISKISRVQIASKEVKNISVKKEIFLEEEGEKFLIFSLEKEKFALCIDYLREIISTDFSFTEIVGGSSEILGLITLREELLLIVDLRIYFGFKSNKSPNNRILVASYNGKNIGLLVDTIIDIKSYHASNIEYMDDLSQKSQISGAIHDNGTLISFFNNQILEKLFVKNHKFIDEHTLEKEKYITQDYAEEMILFKLHDKEYAFNIESVCEIIDAVDFTKVIYTDEFIEGVINIRGEIVTIISLYKKLNLPIQKSKNFKIIICNLYKTKIGFLVDSISDILKIQSSEIVKQEDELFPSLLHLNAGDRLVLSLDVNKVVSNQR